MGSKQMLDLPGIPRVSHQIFNMLKLLKIIHRPADSTPAASTILKLYQ